MDYIDFAHCNYIKMEPNDQIMEQRSYGDRPITARLIVAYFCLAILLCLIIVYAVLSQSLFSTIAVAFLVVLVVISIATPYRLNPLQTMVRQPEMQRVIAYPIYKIICSLFVVVNTIILVFKMSIYFTGFSAAWTQAQKQFMQVQSLLYVFLPILLIPFGCGAALIVPRQRKLRNFRAKINNFLPLPLYLCMGILILLIQIFSVSLAGLVYFALIIYLFAMKEFNFKDGLFRAMLIFIQVFTTLMIMLSYLVNADYLQSQSSLQVFQFVGINSLNTFMTSPRDRGHFICEILLSLMCAYLNHLFIYQQFNSIYVQEVKQVKEQLNESEILGLEKESGSNSDGSDKKMNSQPKEINLVGRVTQKVRILPQQIELKQVSERNSYHSDNLDVAHAQQHQNEEQQKMDRIYFQEVLDLEQEKQEEEKEEKGRMKSKRIKAKQAAQYLKEMRRSAIRLVHTVFNFFNSAQFSLRVVQIISIIVIQRYNNIYSFVALIWLALVASFQNLKLVFVITAFVMLPVEICNYVITYFYNIPFSPAAGINGAQIFGFQPAQSVWLDVIIFNIYINYIILFIRSYSKLKLINHGMSKEVVKRRAKAWELFVAFLFRYSYLLTLIGMFFLGFSKPTIMNIIFVALFLVFFSNGDNLIIVKKMKKGRQRLTLTTFSKKYWPIIVYYTLVCIIVKYIYFLFFVDNSINDWLQPVGINEAYDWSFNFSLSSVCQSNTSPLFIIFVLAEIQIMIYRSYIYINYSFSIMSSLTSNVATKPTTLKERTKAQFISFVVLVNQLYLQSLYYVSGIIIIGCSYQWSFFGLAIIILTCFGLLTSFNKKLLGIILALNLTFLFVNYFILLLTNEDYTVFSNMIGSSGMDYIRRISLLIGFSLNSSSYAGYFILNVVIYYFCVLCYGLSNILEASIENIERRSVMEEEVGANLLEPLKGSFIRSQIHKEESIIDSQFQDEQFATNYKNGVIRQTQTYYNQNLVAKYQGMRVLGKILLVLLTDIVAIFVIVECLYFRLSITMLLFLVTYLIFYFFLFQQIGTLFTRQNFYDRVEGLLDNFTAKQSLLEDRTNFVNFVGDKEDLQLEQDYIEHMGWNVQLLKNKWKARIWTLSAVLSATCLVLTYAAQFVTSDFYTSYVNQQYNDLIQRILFVVGVNVTNQQSFGRFVYFYYVMLIINIVEKLVLRFNAVMGEYQNKVEESSPHQTIGELDIVENPIHLINQYVSEDFIVGVDMVGRLSFREQSPLHFEIPSKEEQIETYYEQANMLIYFEFRFVSITMNLLYGCISFVIRLYLWLMLLNVYAKSNVFGFAYLFAVLFFWFRKLSFSLIKDINKAAIAIVLLQYLVLLFDITNQTSPLPLPTTQSLSLLEEFITQEWVQFIAVSDEQGATTSFLASFLINSIIIFLTELCFTVFQVIAAYMVTLIMKVYLKYESMLQKLKEISDADPIIINYDGYKHFWHRVATFFYENMIMNSYLIVSLLMFMLLSGVHSYLAIVLLTIAFLYIYIGIFTKLSEKDTIFHYTRVYFRIFNILQFIIIFISIVLGMPFAEYSSNSTLILVINEFGALTSIEQVLLMLFIQLWLDLNASKSFQAVSENYREQLKKREAIFLRCLTFQNNNYLIRSLIHQYKQVFSFDTSIGEAMRIIKEWHSTMNKEMKTLDYDFQDLQQGKHIERIKLQIQTEKIADDHRLFSVLLQNFVMQHTYVTLMHQYYDTLKYVIENINGVIFHEDIKLNVWNFILEDYDIIEKMLANNDEVIRNLIGDLIDGDEEQSMNEALANLRNQLRQGEENQHLKIELQTPSKLKIDPQHSVKKSSVIIPFLLSNIEVLIVLLVEIYYLVNPCVLSFPLLVFVFCYYIIANSKYMNLVVLYIFILIIVGEVLETDGAYSPADVSVIKFFFYVDVTTQIPNFNLPYLYFLFVVIFISQQIIRYNGNRYRSEFDVENLQQAFFRVLMNQSEESKLNLWKYSHTEQEFLQNVNPYNIGVYEIENNLQKLLTCESSFSDVFSDRKIGVDLYPPMAAVQIFLTIYLIFFYPLMTDVNGYTLDESTKYFQFSSDMVISVLVHVVSIVVERKLTILIMPRARKLIIKYVWTVVIFLLFSWFIFYLAPYHSSLTLESSLYSPSAALLAFSFFYFIYFYLSALQIKYGYKQFKSMNSLMTRRGYANYYAVSLYTAIPFLYEIKIIMDWSFSDTSLTLYDWFRQFSIYIRAFNSKIEFYNATTNTILGHTIKWYYKITGWIGFIIILLIIFGPMILFSGLNPIAEANLVTSGSMIVSLQVVGGNSFTLYSTSHFSTPPLPYTYETFNAAGFDQVPLLQQMTASDIPQQFESITFQNVSDSNWGISMPNYNYMTQMLNATINNASTNNFTLSVTYQLNREIVSTIASNSMFVYPFSGYLSMDTLVSLYQTLTTCNSPTALPAFYISLIRLNTINNIYKPRPIVYTTGPDNFQPYLQNTTINLICPPNATNITDTNSVYWSLTEQNSTDGLNLYVYCDKYQNIIGGYGFTALYTSIILVVAGFVRSMFDGNLPNIPYVMNPKPDNILQICEAINILRVRKQFREEYLMYYELIDIIRSPEIMKYMSGSYPYLIEKYHLEELEKAEQAEMQKRKTL